MDFPDEAASPRGFIVLLSAGAVQSSSGAAVLALWRSVWGLNEEEETETTEVIAYDQRF